MVGQAVKKAIVTALTSPLRILGSLFGDIKVPGYPVEFSETPAAPGFTAPKLGEHTREILRDIGGYSEAEIARFQRDAVVDGAA